MSIPAFRFNAAIVPRIVEESKDIEFESEDESSEDEIESVEEGLEPKSHKQYCFLCRFGCIKQSSSAKLKSPNAKQLKALVQECIDIITRTSLQVAKDESGISKVIYSWYRIKAITYLSGLAKYKWKRKSILFHIKYRMINQLHIKNDIVRKGRYVLNTIFDKVVEDPSPENVKSYVSATKSLLETLKTLDTT